MRMQRARRCASPARRRSAGQGFGVIADRAHIQYLDAELHEHAAKAVAITVVDLTRAKGLTDTAQRRLDAELSLTGGSNHPQIRRPASRMQLSACRSSPARRMLLPAGA